MTADPPNRNPSPARAVIFDLDGTLIDTEWVFVEAARRLLDGRGIPFDSAFMAEVMGMPARVTLPRFIERFQLPETVDELAALYKVAFFEVLAADVAPLMPGAADLLDRLAAAGVPIALATSSGRAYVDSVFGPHGLLPRFGAVLTADDVTHGKPHPEIYETAARRLGVAPSQTVVIEDSIHGVRAAKAAGARVVIVPHAHTPPDHGTEADVIVSSLAAAELWAVIAS